MNLGTLELSGLSDEYVSELLINFIAFQGLKSQVGEGGLANYLLKSKIDSKLWRGILAIFIGMPWILSELNEDDYILLKQIHEMLSV